MIEKKIQYHDLDGDLREDSFYFSMNETQFARVNGMFQGGLQEYTMNAAKNIKKKPAKAEAPTTKECPFCFSEIPIKATRCPHCTSVIEEK